MESEKIMKAKVSAKGWIVIPAALRKHFGLKPGTIVEVQEMDEKIVITPGTKDPVDEFYGKLGGKRSLTEALIEDRRKELSREEAKVRT